MGYRPGLSSGSSRSLGARFGTVEGLHAAVAGDINEDLALAHRTRRAGLRLGLALGGDLVSARMYSGYRESVAGFGKSLRAAHGGHAGALAVTAAWHLLAYTAPWLAWRQSPLWRAGAVLGLAQRILVNAKTGRGAPGEAVRSDVVLVHVEDLHRRPPDLQVALTADQREYAGGRVARRIRAEEDRAEQAGHSRNNPKSVRATTTS